MLSVYLICVGKLKEKFYKDACAEYVKRLSAYCKLTVIEVEDGYMGWYNGFNNTIEEMGVVKHTGFDLGFDQPDERGGRKYYPKINRVD